MSFTVDTLEKMFVYLGCANIPTQSAMDGAVPVESMTTISGDSDSTLLEFVPSKIESMPASWDSKAIYFNGDSLALATASNIHWSVFTKVMGSFNQASRSIGKRVGLVSEIDGAIRLHYSEINAIGRFEKFQINKRRIGGLIATSIYNPAWTLGFRNGCMTPLASDNDDLYVKKRLDFVAPMLCGIAQSARSYWRVVAKFESTCPSLTMLTDAMGVKEFWKLRDIPEGKKRRDALLHWVSEHWRQKRHDPDVEVFVRKHMRGSDELTQGNFAAKIFASESDNLDLKFQKENRERLRQIKQDRRKRQLKLKKASS